MGDKNSHFSCDLESMLQEGLPFLYTPLMMKYVIIFKIKIILQTK